MKTLISILAFTGSCSLLFSQTAFINEIHYDNIGTDEDEFVEVAIDLTSCPGGACNSSDFLIYKYNGSNGSPYGNVSQRPLPSAAAGGDGLYTLYLFEPTTDIQNGDPDGFALVYNGTVLEFISYEGIITATSGPASGQVSSDIGVEESDTTTPIGYSLQRRPDGSWDLPAPATKGAGNTVPLPVALTAFNAKLTNTGAMLEWTTASEENNDYFAVEMSRDATRFSESAKINGNGTTESFETYTYEYSNLAPGTYYFRLRQVDFDGQYSYSDVVSLTVEGGRDFLMASNTVTDFIAINVTNPRPARVLNMAGAVVAEFALTEGRNKLDISSLAQGMYILSDGINAKRFVK